MSRSIDYDGVNYVFTAMRLSDRIDVTVQCGNFTKFIISTQEDTAKNALEHAVWTVFGSKKRFT